VSDDHYYHIYRKRKELWNAFRESVASGSNTGTSTTAESEAKTVKVEKRYMFAGREIKEIVEVASDSADAKKWPIVPPATSTSTYTDTDRSTLVSKSEIAAESLTAMPAPSTSIIASSSSAPTPLTKRGPRKPKVTLGAIPGSGSSSGSQPRNAPKKLTTLEKSAMDWRSHLSAAGGDALKDELKANRKQNGGGYLEKVEFLERVNERRESLLDASKSGKRRRG